jgi:hypothetical protein
VREIRQWFDGARFEHFLPAICIPFPLWFDIEEPTKDTSGQAVGYWEGIFNAYTYREAKFGVIFDRGRIAQSCADALGGSQKAAALQIDGLDKVEAVAEWVNEAIGRFGMGPK